MSESKNLFPNKAYSKEIKNNITATSIICGNVRNIAYTVLERCLDSKVHLIGRNILPNLKYGFGYIE